MSRAAAPGEDHPKDDPWDHPDARRAGSLLTIDLAALAANYRLLAGKVAPAECGAAVKGDAYGIGLEAAAPALAAAGCKTFFVAQLGEGLALRALLPKATVYVLNGLMRGAEADYPAHGLRPVLNSLGDLEAWRAFCQQREEALPAALQLESGMNRLGLPPEEIARLAAEPERARGISLPLVMSHLACADAPSDPRNESQRSAFAEAVARLRPLLAAGVKASLANSPGIFLGAGFRLDLARPGYALYGGNPTPEAPNPMRQVVALQARILQVREIDAPQAVGYGASFRVAGPTRLATVGVGYADGFLRSLSNRGSAFVGGRQVAVVGRVSMDLITLDVTALPPEQAAPGAIVDLLGPEQDVDALAAQAGTIGYEILTALGARYHRHYVRA